MKFRQLGRTDIELSTVGLGANYVGGHNLYTDIDEEEGVRLVQHAIDLGITHIDTADGYGHGRSEELVGKAIRGRREQVVLATKGGVLFGEHGQGVRNDPAYMRGALERSLRRLDTDYIDLYYIHKFDGVTPVEEAFGVLHEFKEAGLIRAVGASNADLPALRTAVSAGSVDAVQGCYNLLQRDAETDLLPWCIQNGVSFIPWGGLAYGLLGGRYDRDFLLEDGDWRQRTGMFTGELFKRNLKVVDELKSLAVEHDSTAAHLAIQWLMTQPGVSSVIAGAKSTGQVSDNFAVVDANVSPELVTAVDALTLNSETIPQREKMH